MLLFAQQNLVAAVANGILALTSGYFEAAPAEELDSYVQQIIEAPVDDLIVQISTDPEPDAPIESYASTLLTLNVPPVVQPDFIVQITTEPEADAPNDIYCSALLLLDQPAVGDFTQILIPVVLDPEPEDDTPDSYLSLYFDDILDAALNVFFDDEEDSIDYFALDTTMGLVYEDAPVPPPPVVVQYNFVEIRSFTDRRRI